MGRTIIGDWVALFWWLGMVSLTADIWAEGHTPRTNHTPNCRTHFWNRKLQGLESQGEISQGWFRVPKENWGGWSFMNNTRYEIKYKGWAGLSEISLWPLHTCLTDTQHRGERRWTHTQLPKPHRLYWKSKAGKIEDSKRKWCYYNWFTTGKTQLNSKFILHAKPNYEVDQEATHNEKKRWENRGYLYDVRVDFIN